MTQHSFIFRRRRLGWTRQLALAALLPLAACSKDILEVTDPDIINPGDVASPAGAAGLYAGALARLDEATSGGESFFLLGGLLTDEWRSGDTFVQRNETDKRDVIESNSIVNTANRDLHRARLGARLAIDALREFDAGNRVWRIGEMYFVAGFAENMLAEHFCSGIPLSTVEGGNLVYGTPLTTTEVFDRAVAHFDSALAEIGSATDAATTNVRRAASIGKGRALLNLGKFAEAAAAVAAVPTTYQYLVEHSQTASSNQLWALNTSAKRYTVSPGEGTNGIPFATAKDPRVPVGPRVTRGSFDATTDFYPQLKWGQESSVAIASGTEARLIEAEAAYKAGNYAGALVILNKLRSDANIGLVALAPAATPAEQENQIFTERAYWLFSTGHRLGDLRRLVRQYGRSPESVFPTGTFFKGGEYGADVNFPVTQAEENNPEFTGCINRSA